MKGSAKEKPRKIGSTLWEKWQTKEAGDSLRKASKRFCNKINQKTLTFISLLLGRRFVHVQHEPRLCQFRSQAKYRATSFLVLVEGGLALPPLL